MCSLWLQKVSFLKTSKTNKKQKIVFTDNKRCKFIVKAKKHTENTFPKNFLPISKNIIKEKSKCAICLTKRAFIHDTEDKYDLKLK